MTSPITRLLIFASVGIIATQAEPCRAQPIYTNDFQSGMTAGWTTSVGDPAYQRPIGVGTTPTGRRFLGPFGNQEVRLAIASLPPHGEIVLEFDLFVIQSWDGSQISTDGPDVFTVFEPDAGTITRTTFSNVSGLPQAWPDQFPGGRTMAPQTAVAEVNSLGYGREGDAVYRLSFRFVHAGPSLAFSFIASLRDRFPTVENESWGIDNITIAAYQRSEMSAVVQPLDTRGTVGELVNIPILLKNRVGFRSTRASAVRGTLRFNGSMLYPAAQTQIGALEGAERVVPFELPLIDRSDSLLGHIPLRVLLGNDTISSLVVEELAAVGDTIRLTSDTGRFVASGQCRSGETRLIDPWPAAAIKPPAPNPTSAVTRVELTLRRDADVATSLISSDGNATPVLSVRRLERGMHIISIDGAAVSSGIYRCVVSVDGVESSWAVVVAK